VVVLHEGHRKAGQFPESLFVVAFEKKATGIAEHPGLDQQYVGNLGGRDFHWFSRFSSR
jgi:hypothetical protein